MATEEYKMAADVPFPVVYTTTRAYVVMVSADVYRDKVSISDPNLHAFRSDLYMSPYNEQAWAIYDFISKNADKFNDRPLELFGTCRYNRDCAASDFVDAKCGNVTAGMRFGHQLGGHADAQTIVVYQDHRQMRKVRLTEIAFPNAISGKSAAGGGAAGGAAGGASGSRAAGGPNEAGSERSAAPAIFTMQSLLETL